MRVGWCFCTAETTKENGMKENILSLNPLQLTVSSGSTQILLL